MDLISRALVGVFASGTGVTISVVQHVELWLRISSLVVGLAVGISTLVGIFMRLRKDWLKKDD